MINVKSSVKIYEINGEQDDSGAKMSVENHWAQKDMVVISIGGNKYTVSARDLEAAIYNGINTNHC